MRTQSQLITICLAGLAGNPAAGEEASCKAPPAIQFAPGATAGSQTGGIARGELACWALSATQGQRVELKVRSPEGNVVLQFYRPGWALRKEDGDMVVGRRRTALVRAPQRKRQAACGAWHHARKWRISLGCFDHKVTAP